jgi:hypothetical protein
MIIKIDTDYLIKNSITAQDYLIAYLWINSRDYLNMLLKIEPISIESINRLVKAKLLINNGEPGNTNINLFAATNKLKKDISIKGADSKFLEFWDLYPLSVIRIDGSRSVVRTRPEDCKKLYKKIIEENPTAHTKIIKFLTDDVHNRTMTDTLKWMPSMKRWLEERAWESAEIETKNNVVGYDTSLE